MVLKVLEEAQKMAVEQYGVEDKTNLYVGKFLEELFKRFDENSCLSCGLFCPISVQFSFSRVF